MSAALRKVIREYAFLTILNSMTMGFTSAIYVTFMGHFGLDLFQQSVVNVCFFVTMFVMEIPTGVIADLYGRRVSYLISCILTVCGCVVYGCSTTIGGFIVAEVILAVGMTFSSGAFKAWFVDRMKHFGHTERLTKVFARMSYFGACGSIVSAIAGSYLYVITPSMPWFACGVVAAVTVLCAYRIKEEYFVSGEVSLQSHFSFTRSAVKDFRRYAVESGVFRFVMGMSAAMYVFIAAPNMQWQPFLGDIVGEVQKFGFLFFAIRISVMAGAKAAPYLVRNQASEQFVLICTHVGTAVALICSATLQNPWMVVVWFMLHEFGRGVTSPILDAYLHEHISSHQRATMDSCVSVVRHVAGAIGLLFGGLLAKHIGISKTWIIMSIVMTTMTLMVARRGNQK